MHRTRGPGTTVPRMNPEAAKRLRLLASALSVLLLLALLTVGWFFWRLRASLPQLDGTAPLAGLGGEVTVERDALGVPRVRARSRLDAARALGFLDAQDRFFQMDLLRRLPAGELAEMFGARAVPRDRAMRLHGFRKLAEQVVAQLPDAQRAILDAYVAGVNTGLSALREKPFEYLVLREPPQPWRAADSVLVIYAMTLDLQGDLARYEQAMMTLRDELGDEGVAFFNPLVTPDDAALDGSTAPLAPIPGPRLLDLRAKKLGALTPAHAQADATLDAFPLPPRDPEAAYGSNAFALSGAHTASGAGLLASDMHLDHAVPNIWYRAALEWPEKDQGPETADQRPKPETSDARSSAPNSTAPGATTRRVVGVTLPGTPAIVVGSNGDVAWGFTHACVDTGDLIVLQHPPNLPGWYITPAQPDGVKLESRHEIIRVKGGADVAVDYPWSAWGPVVGSNERGEALAFHWMAHDVAATNFLLLTMENASTVAAAVAVAHRAGIPAQNLVVADRAGDVAWTITGRLPQRVGYDGRLPVTWAFGDRKWAGLLPPSEVPVVSTAAGVEGAPVTHADTGGRIWSANQRQAGGDALAKLGDGDYSRPHRAGMIRDDLAKLEKATPRDLLAVVSK